MSKTTVSTQCGRVLSHLEEFGSITQLEALEEYGIMRLASRINDLRQMGYPIETRQVKTLNRYGEKVSYARYTMN